MEVNVLELTKYDVLMNIARWRRVQLEISLKVINTPAPRSYSLRHSMFCFSVFGIICRYHGNTHSATVPKCVLHIYTSKQTCVPSLIWKCFFPSIVGICHYHGNTFFPILKSFLHIYTSRPTCKPNFFCIACEMLFSSFFNNTLLPWQRTSRHCPKMCHAQLHFNVNMYAKFDLKCLSPSIFGIICRYHGNTLSSTVKSVFCTTTPSDHHVCQISL